MINKIDKLLARLTSKKKKRERVDSNKIRNERTDITIGASETKGS